MQDGDTNDTPWNLLQQEGFSALMGPVHARFGGDGSAVFRFETNADHRNRNGFIHGGVLLALADQCMGQTARQDDPGRFHVTLQIDMQFISAVKPGAVIELRCMVVSARRKVDFIEAEIFGDGDLVAKAHGVWRKYDKASNSEGEHRPA